jgi:uncharacterized protein
MSTGRASAGGYIPRMSHEGYHEPAELLPETTKDFHRAIVSLMEELEAIDWYQQRADATKDEALRAIMMHNRNEEAEHAMMTLEWLRRRDAKIDEVTRTYLFAEGEITKIEEAKKNQAAAQSGATVGSPPHPASLGIGSLRSL